MKQRILQIITSMLLIITLTMANFLLLCVDAVSYAVDSISVDNSTNHKNVEFMAYFKDENGNKVTSLESSTNNNDLKLYLHIAVKKEGYFNGNVTLETSNFKFSSQNLNNDVNAISENMITLNQINAGDEKDVELNIDIIKDDNFDLALVDLESEIVISGTYKDSTQKDIKINLTKNVKLSLVSPYDENNEGSILKQKVITNKVLNYNDEQKRVIQIQVNSGIENNLFPIKSSLLELSAPKILDKYPEIVLVNSIDNLTSTGSEILESDYSYNKENGTVKINLQNTPNDNKVSWMKTGEDIITVTYIFEDTDEVTEQYSKIESEITLYDENNTKLNTSSDIKLSNEQKDSIISIDSKQSEKNIYKGKLYEEISRDIAYSTYLNVNLADVADNITLIEEKETVNGEGFSYNFDSVYKSTQIKKSDLEEILGQDGKINILNAVNGEQIATITVNNDADENGYINVIYSGNIRQIQIATTKPQKVGKIEIKNTKTINSIDTDVLKSSSNLKYIVNGKYSSNNEETQLQEATSNIELKETETSAKLEINKTDLSVMTTNENVEFRVILESKNENNELFENPTIKIELPEKFENIEVTSINLIYEDELKIESKSLVGNTIEITLSGKQTRYKEEAIDGAILIINTNLTTSKKISSSTETVKLTYSNENAKNYKNGLSIGQEQKELNIVSYAGMITTSKITDYGIEVINNEGNKTAKLEIASESKNIEVKNEIINNVGNTVNNVNIIGTFPTKDAVKDVNNIDIAINETLKVQGIDSNRVKIYYSNNVDATPNLEDLSNQWTESIEDAKNVKKYLVVIDKLDVYEQVDLSYSAEIPAGLDYNKVAEQGYNIYYTNTNNNVEENVELDNIKLETGKGPVVDTTLKAYVGNEEATNVKEGEIVTYSLTIANTGTEETQNVKAVAKIPENTVYIENNKMEYEMSDEEMEYTPFVEKEEQQEVEFNIEKLAVGEETTRTYQVKVKDNVEGKTITNVAETAYGEVSKTSNEVQNNVESADLQLELYSSEDINGVLENGYTYRYVLNVKNISDKDKKDVKVEINGNDIIDIQEIFYIAQDGNSISEKENNYINIDSIKAGEKIEVCIVMKAKTIRDGEKQSATISAKAVQNDITYHSNTELVTVKPIKVQTNIVSENSDSYVKEGDVIEYIITLKNDGEEALKNIVIENKLSNKTTLVEVAKNGEKLSEESYSQNAEVTGENVIEISDELEANKQVEYRIKAVVDKIPGNESSVEITASVNIYSDSVEIDSKEIKHILGPEETDKTTDNTNNNVENNNNNNSQNNNSQNNQGESETNTTNTEKNKAISGTAWLDENKDGQKDSKEQLLEGMSARLLDTKTNTFVKDSDGVELLVKTNENGFYSFDSIEQGEYIVIFEYDTSKYVLTSYEQEGVESKNTSKVINKTVTIDGNEKTVGATEIIKVGKNNISNINIGLQKAMNFDLKLDKYISKVVIQNSKGTSTKEYTDTTFAKAEIDAKLMNATTVVVEYTIKVTNVGDADAYVKKVADYISKDYKFTSELNKDWYQSEGTLYNSSLSNEKLQPGESKELKLVVTKQMSENNTGLINNTAEIVESYNDYGLKDNNDNDKAVADLILSIKTGQIVTTVGLILTTIIIIASAAYIVLRYVLKRRII